MLWKEQQYAPYLGSLLGLVLVPVFCLDRLCQFKSVLRKIEKTLSLSDVYDETSLRLILHLPICDNFSSDIVPVTEWCSCIIASHAA